MGNKFSIKRGPESAFTKPTGLYPSCEWDDKTVKKLINKKKIAPRYPGREDQGPDLDECPICFLWYPGGLNRSKCCGQSICTECFLQFKKPAPARPIECPFCKAQNYTVKFSGAKTKEEREAIAQEEQMVIEAKIRIQKEELAQQQQKEAELAAEREKRLREGPPAAESPPPAAHARESGGAVRQEHPRSSSTEQHQHHLGGIVAAAPNTPHRLPVLSAPVTDMPPNVRESPSDQEEEQHSEAEFHSEIEDLMVMEAIRLSLLDNAGRRSSVEDDSTEAGASGRVVEGDDQVASGDLDDSDAEAGQVMDDEDWPAVTWGNQGHETILRHQGGAAGLRESAFEDQVNRVALEMEQDACLFELLVISNHFFTPDTSTSANVTTSDGAAVNHHQTETAANDAESCANIPGNGQGLPRGDEEEEGDFNEQSCSGIALEFEERESSGAILPAVLESVGASENHESVSKAQDLGMLDAKYGDRGHREVCEEVVSAVAREEGGATSPLQLTAASTRYPDLGEVGEAAEPDDEDRTDAGASLPDVTSPSTTARASSVPASPFIDFVREHHALQEGMPQMGAESSLSNSLSSPVSASETHAAEQCGRPDVGQSESAHDAGTEIDDSPRTGSEILGVHLGRDTAIPEGYFYMETTVQHDDDPGDGQVETSTSEHSEAAGRAGSCSRDTSEDGQETRAHEVEDTGTEDESSQLNLQDDTQIDVQLPQASKGVVGPGSGYESEKASFSQEGPESAVASDQRRDDKRVFETGEVVAADSTTVDTDLVHESAAVARGDAVSIGDAPAGGDSHEEALDFGFHGDLPSTSVAPDLASLATNEGTGPGTFQSSAMAPCDTPTEVKVSDVVAESAHVGQQAGAQGPHVSLSG
jgi:hypothetical protein